MPYRITKPSVNTPRVNYQSSQSQGLTNWWPMLPAGGRVLRDIMGRASGIFKNQLSWEPDPISQGYALFMDGANGSGYVDVGNQAGNFSSGNFTVSFWAKPNGLSTINFLLKDLGFGARSGIFIYKSNTSFLYWNGGGNIITTFTGSGLWDHWAVSRESLSSNGVSCYKNGRLAKQLTDSRVLFNSENLCFGADSDGGTGTSDCSVRDIRFYNYAVPSGIIYQMYSPQTRFDLYEYTDPLNYRSRILNTIAALDSIAEMRAFRTISFNSNMNLFTKNEIGIGYGTGALNLYTWSFSATGSGLADSMDLYLASSSSGDHYTASTDLFLDGFESGSVNGLMSLYLSGAGERVTGELTLALANNFVSGYLPLYINGGNLFGESDPTSDGALLFGSGMPLYLERLTGNQIHMYLQGPGDIASGVLPLCLTGGIASTGVLDLAMPNTYGQQTETVDLYINGW